jgi:hypothetical protein
MDLTISRMIFNDLLIINIVNVVDTEDGIESWIIPEDDRQGENRIQIEA